MTENNANPAGRYEIVRGQLSDDEKVALNEVLDGLAQAAEDARNTKPDTRGLWGHQARVLNPTGFRNPSLPCQPSKV